MTTDSVFWIASMTKAVTTAACMQLVEQGKLKLDEPIGKLLPDLASPQVLEGFDAKGEPKLRPAKNPITLTRSVSEQVTKVSLGGAPAYVYPGGGITIMVDVLRLPDNAFGYVPTPALVAPIEFTLPRDIYEENGGHAQDIVPLEQIIEAYSSTARIEAWTGK